MPVSGTRRTEPACICRGGWIHSGGLAHIPFMRSFLPHLAVVALSGCLSPVLALSQPYTLLIKDYTTQDGLPDSRVAPIRQDSKGYLWFGTQAGLTRYDGHEFQTFGGAKDIPGIFGRDIFEDHCGAIWFAYSGFSHGGLLRYSDGAVTEFTRAVDAIGGQAVSVVEDSSHALWVGSGTGLLSIRFTDALRTSWTMETFPNIAAMALFVDQRKRLWVGTSLGELLTYDNGTFATVLTGLAPSIRPYAMYETRGRELWVGGIFGVAVIKDGTVRRFGTADGLPPRGCGASPRTRTGTSGWGRPTASTESRTSEVPFGLQRSVLLASRLCTICVLMRRGTCGSQATRGSGN